MTPRLRFAIAAGIVSISIIGLIVWSLTGSTSYYLTPAELNAGAGQQATHVRVAGKVVAGSVRHTGAQTSFAVTDGRSSVDVKTADVLPDTFGTGVEVVAEGAMTKKGYFSASTVLAKCPSKFKARINQAAKK